MVKASAIPGRVPLGFICGYPLEKRGGELYGGSMFARSAAPDTLQGKAIAEVNRKWGEDSLQREGRETLGIPVCKKKYTPFTFPIVAVAQPQQQQQQQLQQLQQQQGGSSSANASSSASSTVGGGVTYEVQVERMFGCKCHHPLRKSVIERYGERKGWEPFGQWSLKKAQELARQETQRLNNNNNNINNNNNLIPSSSNGQVSSSSSSSASSFSGNTALPNLSLATTKTTTTTTKRTTSKSTSTVAVRSSSSLSTTTTTTPAVSFCCSRALASTRNGSSNSISDDKDENDADDDADDENNDNTTSNGVVQYATSRSKHLLMGMSAGKCLWKLKSAYDNVFKELTGHTESEAED